MDNPPGRSAPSKVRFGSVPACRGHRWILNLATCYAEHEQPGSANNGHSTHDALRHQDAIEIKDRHGNIVGLGDVVRVVELCQDFLDVLPEDELVHIESMLNQQYPIDAFPEQHKASVSNNWEIGPGLTAHSGLSMLSHEFELVRKAETMSA